VNAQDIETRAWTEQAEAWSDEPINRLLFTLAGTGLAVVLVIMSSLLTLGTS
jgi:hypothetical protein